MVKHFASQSRLRRPRFYSGCIIARHSAESRPFGGQTRTKGKPCPPMMGMYPGFSPAKGTAYFLFLIALSTAIRRLPYASYIGASF